MRYPMRPLEPSVRGCATSTFVSFYDFPMGIFVHLRTTNALESVFGEVRLRKAAARRMKRRNSAFTSCTRW